MPFFQVLAKFEIVELDAENSSSQQFMATILRHFAMVK